MKKIIKRISFITSLAVIFIVVCMCMFRINVINTSNLSIDKYDSKYIDIMEDDSKEEYMSFIKDNCYVKIYDENDGYRVKCGENQFYLRDTSRIISYIKNFFDKIESLF